MIQLIVFDVDGVLTDGCLYYSAGGVGRAFHIRDGYGMRSAREAGLRLGILTAKVSASTQRRAADLQVDHFFEGVDEKGGGIERLAAAAEVPLEQTAYLGDDLLDLPALVRVGYPMAVSDAVAEVRQIAAYVTQAPGGRGAAREAIEHILHAQGKWDGVVSRVVGDRA